MEIEIVTTSINPLDGWLKSIKENLDTYSSKAGIQIVADLKSPDKHNLKLIKDLGLPIKYWTVTEQQKFLKDLMGKKGYEEIFPCGWDFMRGFGFITAVNYDAKTIISMDDDNLPTLKEDFIKEHRLGYVGSFNGISSKNRWINTMDRVEKGIFSRGYPIELRDSYELINQQIKGLVELNVGLWYDQPDIDAFDRLRLQGPTPYRKYQKLGVSLNCYLSVPIQNTAFSSKLLPLMNIIRQGVTIHGITTNRVGDIWQGIIVKKAMNNSGSIITVGSPTVWHKRNIHTSTQDLLWEYWQNMFTYWYWKTIDSISLSGKNYYDNAREIIQGLEKETLKVWNDKEIQDYWLGVCSFYWKWLEIVEKVL